ncbi:MAG TPA: DNA repair protein RecO [Mariprofundaceae bacterium]|nr:DNA repair protein RecO [Mariprofundaceae bacterium]
MSEVRDRAMLLRRIAYGESSLVVHMLTAGHGRIALMAKGARRAKSPFRATLAPLHELDVAWRPGRTGMGTLTGAERGEPLLPEHLMYDGLELSALASGIFQEGEPQGFEELRMACRLLAERAGTTGLLAAAWYLLDQGGWVGSLGHCWHCGREAEPLYWSKGYLHCADCDRGAEVSRGACRGILGHMRSPRVYLPEHDVRTWRTMVQDVLRLHGLRILSSLASQNNSANRRDA